MTANQKIGIVLLPLGLLFGLVYVGYSHTFQHCVEAIKHYPEYDASDEKIPTFVRLAHHLRVIGQCEVVVIDKHNGVIAAFAAFVVAFFTYTLWRSTEKLWEAGERQIAHLRESSEREQRAYLMISSAGIHNIEDVSGREACLIMKNFGATPAANVRFLTWTLIQAFPIPELPPIDRNRSDVGNSIMAPGMISDITVPVAACNPYEDQRLKLGTAAIYAYGVILYDDAFGKARETRFRYMCWGEGLPKGRMAACTDGNSYT